MEKLKQLPPEKIHERELSILETLLLKNDNPKIAVTMALDMMTAGIDTVSYIARTNEHKELSDSGTTYRLPENLQLLA